MTPDRTGPALILLATLFSVACSGLSEDPTITLPASSPEDGALALFMFAATLNEGSRLPEGLVRDDLADEYEGDLLDCLEPVAGAAPPRILNVVQFPETDRAAVDLELDLPGQGFATWSVQLEHGPDAGWRVIWVQGPDAGWPPIRKRGGEGMSTSPANRR